MLEENTIHLGDCLDLMRLIPDKSIDLILCDLPYGTTKCKWDVVIPFNYLWEHYGRIIKDNGAIVLFGQEPFSSTLRLSNLPWYRYDWYWQKERPTNVMQVKRRAGKVIETISVFYKSQCTYNPQKTVHTGKLVTNRVGKNGSFSSLVDAKKTKPYNYRDDRTRHPLQLLKFNRDTVGATGRNLHPTQKPVALCEYLIKTYTNEGELVLDNCAGSGTTGVACLNLGRRFICIEKDPDYYAASVQRLKDTQAQLRLF